MRETTGTNNNRNRSTIQIRHLGVRTDRNTGYSGGHVQPPIIYPGN